MNEFIELMEFNNEKRKEYGPSPLLKFVSAFDKKNNLIKEVKITLERETDIPKNYIPQDMDDELQQILGCGKYAKEIK